MFEHGLKRVIVDVRSEEGMAMHGERWLAGCMQVMWEVDVWRSSTPQSAYKLLIILNRLS